MLFIKQKMCHVAILNIAYIIRDGPLEKLWGGGGGGEGNFRAAGLFFHYPIPCMNFFSL